jgi:hypothetical protein
METIYCENWHRIRKEIRRPLDAEAANTLFDSGEHFFAMIFKNGGDKPTHLIEFLGINTFGVDFLDEDLDEELSFSYQLITNNLDIIDPSKLIISRFVVREKDKNGKQTKGTAYNPILMVAKDKWEIQHNLFCEEEDFIKKESSNFYTKNKVDISSLYKDIPEFGKWEDLINTEVKFLNE